MSPLAQAITKHQEVRNSDKRFLVRKMRLCPAPWFNTYVFVHGDELSPRANISAFPRPKLCQALQQTDIELDESWTWLLPKPPIGWTQ
jgi:hypothetical protein